MTIDPFTAHRLSINAIKLIPNDCKEINPDGSGGPEFTIEVITDRKANFFCDQVDNRDPICMKCKLIGGREISI